MSDNKCDGRLGVVERVVLRSFVEAEARLVTEYDLLRAVAEYMTKGHSGINHDRENCEGCKLLKAAKDGGALDG